MDIVKFISSLEGASTLGASSESDVNNAEMSLGLKFAEDYRRYLLNFRYFAYESLELTGIVDQKAFNVVEITKFERQSNDWDENLYVVSELGIDSIVILQDQEGNIYESKIGMKPKKIYNNLLEYIKSVIQ